MASFVVRWLGSRSDTGQKGWRTAHIYQYQGFWVAAKLIESIIDIQRNFQPLNTDILLVTTPKSGTVWLKALAFAIVNRNRYPLISQNPLLNTNPHDLVPFLEYGVFINNQIPYISTLPSPRLYASHIPYTSLPESIKNTTDCRIVYLCRNPKDMFVSLLHFMGKLRPENLGPLLLEQAFESFCMGAYEFGPYWDHMLGFWKESLEKPEKVLFLKYEELKEDTNLNLKRIAQFLGCPFTVKEDEDGVVDEILEMSSFESLKNLEVNKTGKLMARGDNAVFFRKGKVGDWVNQLSPEMAEQLDKLTEEKLCGSGLSF
ncbi:cytosolic sulfotransferase 15-like [Telopea speciosissima]|uniref:cytosolic sulfotransferase 15-like n=1 Tax=Telopea speciosissima TaxID=54955 RepID=UPI001CC69144|nr:cytosolic sulfotransferase 15-like [Telopea speciosissima]